MRKSCLCYMTEYIKIIKKLRVAIWELKANERLLQLRQYKF